MSEQLYLPVSIGEALDKLSILDIKLDMIKDSRRENVKIEYDLLYIKLENYIVEFKFLYDEMKKINHEIWLEMDKLRDAQISDEKYLKVCKKTVIDNDIRFRIKNKINNLAKSNIKEQKGYLVTKFYLTIINDDIKLHEFCINYFSLRYDEIYVSSNLENEIKIKFNYDPTIKFVNNNEYNNIYINQSDNINNINLNNSI